jgi:hypothetical protein
MVQRFEEGPTRIPNTDNKRELEMFLQDLAQTVRHRIRFPLNFCLTSGGAGTAAISIGNLIVPEGIIEPVIKLISISAWTNGATGAGGDTTIVLSNYTSGTPVTIATLTMPTALATYTIVSQDFEEDIPGDARLILTTGTDGGHRAIFATAWFSQIPRRL